MCPSCLFLQTPIQGEMLGDLNASFLDNLPKELSPHSYNVLATAVSCARDRCHNALGTEHVLHALINCRSEGGGTPRAVKWIESQVGKVQRELAIIVDAELNDRPLWSPYPKPSPRTLPLTSCLLEALNLMAQFSRTPVYDPLNKTMHQRGLVASEFILAGILVEGTSVAADILHRITKGKVNSKEILKVINVDGDSLLRKSGDIAWTCQTWIRKAVAKEEPALERSVSAWVPTNKVLPGLKTLTDPPSSRSNWLVPGHLLIGAKPGGYYDAPDDEVRSYLEAGVTTFVCLIGEYRTTAAYMAAYPEIAKSISQSSPSGAASLDFIHFPIRDFETTEGKELEKLVLELKRRLLQGEVLYIHCLGGHGRTGMVVIPLMMALFNVDYSQAESFVNESTRLHRVADRGWRHNMPETDQQAEVAEASEDYVKKRGRRREPV